MKINFDKADTLKEKNDFGENRINEVKLILIQSTGKDQATTAYANPLNIGRPAHYVIDHTQVIKYAPFSTNLLPPDQGFTFKADQALEYNPIYPTTSIDRIMSMHNLFNDFSKTPQLNSTILKDRIDEVNNGDFIITIEVCSEGAARLNYDAVSENLTRFLGYMMAHHGFKKEQIWRVGDVLANTTNPYQYYHVDHFYKLLDNAETFSKNMNAEPLASPYCFSPHDPPKHIHLWEGDSRKMPSNYAISVSKDTMHDEDFTSQTINGSIFEESNFQPTSNQSFVNMGCNLYEPIYPDLTTPPRNSTGLYNNGVENTKQILEKLVAVDAKKELDQKEFLKSNVELAPNDVEQNAITVGTSAGETSNFTKTPEEIDEESKINKAYDEAFKTKKINEEKLKPVLGKIPNIFDPYPVDDKIVQLEHHAPMVTLEYEESNAVTNNTAFFLINRANNTEKRLVQLENILATQTRMLNRLSSRIKINCVYYGGQSVNDKYKCIRCLSDDLISDAAIVSLDQCLNCSRYEPIEGQVYEIMQADLDPGEANIFDDIQASYMTKQDYVELTRVEEMNVEDPNPIQDMEKISQRNDADLSYEELLAEANNFVMNWQKKALDYQSPHINKYEYDFTKVSLDIDRLKPENKYEDGWNAIEQYKYDRPDYGTSTLGNGASQGGFDFSTTGANGTSFTLADFELDEKDTRYKILEYANQAIDFCLKSKTFQYTFGAKIIDRTKTPDELVEMALAGKDVSTGKQSNDTELAVYTDCSNFVNYIYYIASGGKLDIPGTSATLKESREFKVIGHGGKVLEAIKSAIPGDIILYRGVDSGHVAIFAGKDEELEASYDSKDKFKQICRSKIKDRSDFYGILRHVNLSEPKLKNVQYVEIDCTINEYIQKYQVNRQKNTVTGTSDTSYVDTSNSKHMTLLRNYIDPKVQFTTDRSKMQFCVLDENVFPDNYLTAEGFDKYFAKKGKKHMPNGAAWIQAGKLSGANPLFIMASCAVETGWCEASSWMNGSGRWKDPSNGKTLYNAYGLWCYNEPSPPKRQEAIKQCSQREWYTKEKAAAEGAVYFADKYYGPEGVSKYGIRNTPYLMKWHMGTLIDGNAGTPGSMQYASDIKYAETRAGIMYDCMECMQGGAKEGMKYLRYLIPKFKDE